MSTETQQFDIALGRCSVRDGVLVIDRSDPDAMGRLELFRNGISTWLEHRPLSLAGRLGVSLALGLLLVALLVWLYLSNPAVAPLIVLLGLLGALVVAVPLEASYRRAIRTRDQLRTELADEFRLVDAARVPLTDVTGVTVREITTGGLLGDGALAIVCFEHDDGEAATYLGFPEVMADERATAKEVFEHYGIDVADER